MCEFSAHLLRASDDIDNFVGDGSLTGPVELQAQVCDHFLCVGGCGVHCGTAGSLLGSAALAQGTVKHTAQILGNNGIEHFFVIGLVHGDHGGSLLFFTFLANQRQDLHGCGSLGKDGDEGGVGDADFVEIGSLIGVAKLLCKAYLAGEVDEIYLAYTRFDSVLSQTATAMQLLPLQAEAKAAQSTMEYEPDAETVLGAMIPEYLGGIFYGALCESRASEQAARRTAMDSATQNAEEMIADLSLQFNRARQAAITQEITEIVAGS